MCAAAVRVELSAHRMVTVLILTELRSDEVDVTPHQDTIQHRRRLIGQAIDHSREGLDESVLSAVEAIVGGVQRRRADYPKNLADAPTYR
jgi:hypothetical protein